MRCDSYYAIVFTGLTYTAKHYRSVAAVVVAGELFLNSCIHGSDACPHLLSRGKDLIIQKKEAVIAGVPQFYRVHILKTLDAVGPIAGRPGRRVCADARQNKESELTSMVISK